MDISLLQEVLAFIEKQQTLLNEQIKNPENAKEYQDIHMKIASKIIDGMKKRQELNEADLKCDIQKDTDNQTSTGDSGLDIEENFIKMIEEDEEVESEIAKNEISVLHDKDNSVFVVKDITKHVNKSDVATTETKSNEDHDKFELEKSTTISENKKHVEKNGINNNKHSNASSIISIVDTDSDEYVPDKYAMNSFAIRSDYKFRENRKSIDVNLLQSDEETKPKKKLKEQIPLLYKCELCGESSKDQQELKTHVQKHNAKVLYSCKVCGQLFPWLSTLRQHIVKHKKEREQNNHKQMHSSSSAPNQCEKSRKRVATQQYGRSGSYKRKFSRNQASKHSLKNISLIA